MSAAAVAAAPSPELAETLPAPISFSEPAVAPSFTALPAAPAPPKPLVAALAASANPAVPTMPAATIATPFTNSASAQLSLPATLVPANITITSSLESNSTAAAAAASLSPSNVTAAAQNLPAEPLVLTQDGMMYDLKGIASNGSCLTLWQLIQLSPNLTSWAFTIQVVSKAPCSETVTIFGLHAGIVWKAAMLSNRLKPLNFCRNDCTDSTHVSPRARLIYVVGSIFSQFLSSQLPD